MTTDSIRLFIAIDLPADVRSQLSDVTKRLKIGCRFADAHPKWAAIDNLHVTILFLGNTPEHKIPVVVDILSDVASRINPFDLALDGLGLFPVDAREPKVLGATIAGQMKALRMLYSSLAGELQRADVFFEDRPFRPHLTLARLTSIKTSSRLAPLAQTHSHMLNAKFPVKEVVLFESHLSDIGTTYTPRYTASLTPQKPEPVTDQNL